jgi:outer membrane protein assembly factor BamB
MSNQVLGVDWKAIKKQWAYDPADDANAFYSSAAVTKDSVVLGCRNKKIYCLDRLTGRERWSYITEGVVDNSPVVVNGRVYCGCGSADSLFYVLDLKTGRLIQKLEFDRTVTGSAAVGPDCILVGTEKGTLYCLGAK